MAFFGVTSEIIETSCIHPKADRLSICTLVGMHFSFVTQREQFKPGDSVLYFPLDSILPESIITTLGLKGKLAGKDQNRVKTVILRGEISQGVVEAKEKFLTPDQFDLPSEELTALLGVTKFNPVPNEIQDAVLMPLPTGVSAYDIEGADRFVDVVEFLMDQPVQITEKLEGENFGITVNAQDEISVCLRENSIVPISGVEHLFWKTAREQGFLNSIHEVAAWVRERVGYKAPVTLYGELCRKDADANLYRLPATAVFCFDIRTDRGFLPVSVFEEAVAHFGLKRTPLLSVGITLRVWLDGRDVKKACTGPSALNPDGLREGIVIKPMVESRWARGRVIIKQRCPRYLAGQK